MILDPIFMKDICGVAYEIGLTTSSIASSYISSTNSVGVGVGSGSGVSVENNVANGVSVGINVSIGVSVIKIFFLTRLLMIRLQ